MTLNIQQLWSLLHLGHTFYTHGRYQEARAVFEGLTSLDTRHPYPWYALGLIAKKHREYNRAAEYLHYALRLDEQDRDIRLALAEVLLEQDQLDAAQRILEPCLGIEPSMHDSPALRRARMLWRQWFSHRSR